MPGLVDVVHDEPMNDSAAHRVVDALIIERLLDPAAREHSVRVVKKALQVAQAPVGDTGVVPPRLPQLVEVIAYLGGALVLAAGGLFLAQEWDGLSYATQVTMLAVVIAVLGAIAGVALVTDAAASLQL